MRSIPKTPKPQLFVIKISIFRLLWVLTDWRLLPLKYHRRPYGLLWFLSWWRCIDDLLRFDQKLILVRSVVVSMRWAWASLHTVAKRTDKVVRALLLNLLEKLLLVQSMRMSALRAVLVRLTNHVSLAAHGVRQCNSHSTGRAVWQLRVSKLYASVLAGHLLHRVVEPSASMRVGGMDVCVLVRHDVVAEVVRTFVLAVAVVLLREQVSASGLRPLRRTSIAVLGNVGHPLGLLLLNHVVVFIHRGNVGSRSLRWNASIWLIRPWIIICSYSCAFYVARIFLYNITLILLSKFEWLRSICTYLLSTWCSNDAPANGVRFVFWRSLTLVAFLLDNKLVLIQRHFNLVRDRRLGCVVEPTELLLALVTVKLWIIAPLWQNCRNWNSATHRVDLRLGYQLVSTASVWSNRASCCCFLINISINRVFVLTGCLVLKNGILDLPVQSSSYVCTNGSSNLALSIESAELRLILDKVVLTVLNNSLVIELSDSSLRLWLCIFVCVFHLFLSLIHVWTADWLDLLVQWPRKHILLVFLIETTRPTFTPVRTNKHLVAVGSVLVWDEWVVDVLLVRQVKTRTVCHVHFEAAWGERLSLSFLNTSYLFFRMRDWAVMLLRVLLQ